MSKYAQLEARLSSSRGSGSNGVDIGADESLAEDGKEAALGLLARGGADIDELVDASGEVGGYEMLVN